MNFSNVDLSNCEKEPIHIPNTIQSFGFLLLVSIPQYQIVQCSTNVSHFLGLDSTTLLHSLLSELFSEEDMKWLRECEKGSTENHYHRASVCLGRKASFFNLTVRYAHYYFVIEAEPRTESSLSMDTCQQWSWQLIQDLKRAKKLHKLADVMAKHIRKITHYDRVMVYEFDKDWNGNVIAESRIKSLDPFLGHHFPASDIPQQARKIYHNNTLRIIPDVNYSPINLEPTLNPITQQPLDMSLLSLRSVSPMHIEYLQNMGVSATLVISIMVGDHLWGLIACHHHSPKYMAYDWRNLLEHYTQIFAYHVDFLEDISRQKFDLQIEHQEKELIKKILQEQNLHETLSNHLDLLLKFNNASGVVFYANQQLYKEGVTPNKNFIESLIDWLFVYRSEGIYITDSLCKDFEPAFDYSSVASGILALRFSKYEKSFIIWFKPEVSQSIIWAGNPYQKNILQHDNEIRLSPRKSFEKWEETVKNKSLPWQEEEIKLAESFRLFLMEYIANQTTLLEAQNLALNIKVQEQVLEVKKAHHFLQDANEMLKQQNEELIAQNEEIYKLYKALKGSRHNLKTVLDNITQVFFFLDRDCNLVFFNQLAAKLVEQFYEKKLLIGQHFLTVIEEEKTRKAVERNFQKALLGNGVSVESEIIREDINFHRWYKYDYNPVYDQGEIIGVVVLMIDITVIKQAQKYIETQNKTLRKIAFIQSHEVRRPLANILGLLHLIKTEDPTEKEGYLALLEQESNSLDDIIHKIVNKINKMNSANDEESF